MVRRRLQGIGALQIQHNSWILPYTSEHEQFLNKISIDLTRQHYVGQITRWQADNDTQQYDLINKFQSARQQEYAEFVDQEQQLSQALAHDMQTEQWTFEKLEAHEHSLHKLTVKQRSIQQRDFFSAPSSLTANDLLEKCSQAVYEFALMVYTYYSSTP